MRPVDVSLENQENIIARQEMRKSHKERRIFHINDSVRIARAKTLFAKGYEKTFTAETFTVIGKSKATPHLYTLRDSVGNIIEGRFYAFELLPI